MFSLCCSINNVIWCIASSDQISKCSGRFPTLQSIVDAEIEEGTNAGLVGSSCTSTQCQLVMVTSKHRFKKNYISVYSIHCNDLFWHELCCIKELSQKYSLEIYPLRWSFNVFWLKWPSLGVRRAQDFPNQMMAIDIHSMGINSPCH